MSPPCDAAAAHSKPCTGCRKRKVRCDKTRPCSNCSKTKQLCTYDDFESDTRLVPLSDGDVNERLARTEERLAQHEKQLAQLQLFMAAMMGEAAASLGGSQSPERDLLRVGHPGEAHNPYNMISPSASSTTPLIDKLSLSKTTAPVGHIIFQDGQCAYFDSDFWPALIPEIDDYKLRRLFDRTTVTPNEVSPWIFGSPLGLASPLADLTVYLPSLEQSNILLKLFFDSVNPFVQVEHNQLFARELNQYRRGTFPFPQEFESLLFSIYTLTINSIREEVIRRIFSASKAEMLARFQPAAQAALTRVDFHKTDRILPMQALAHYLTFLFQQNLYQEATALLGLTICQLRSFGLHRDPSHFPFNPWVSGIRRRGFNVFFLLNALAISSFGAESLLAATTDTKPPINANDADWHASRFAKPGSVPQDESGFKDMTFVLVHRDIADLTISLTKVDPRDLQEKERMIHQTESSLYEKYLKLIDRSNPSQTIVQALVEVKLKSLRLTLSHRASLTAKAESKNNEKKETFIAAVKLLEAIQYHIETFSPHNWEWVFRTVVPWLPCAIVITYLSSNTSLDQGAIDRAQKQLDIVWERFSDSSDPVTTTPMWNLLMGLKQCHAEPSSVVSSGSGVQQYVPRFPVFAEDLMDFNQTQGQANLNLNQVMHDEYQDMPWMNTQMPF